MKRIGIGDSVRIEFEDNTLFAKVTYVPLQSGELWEFDTIGGQHIAINTANPNFRKIEVLEKAKSATERL